MAGVGALSLLIGTGTAWLVTMYRFPGRRVLQWLLLLPLAVPTYIIAYSYLELFDYSGIVQQACARCSAGKTRVVTGSRISGASPARSS
jgi:iron(III) transport system permease protein